LFLVFAKTPQSKGTVPITSTKNKYGFKAYKPFDFKKRLFYIDILILNHVLKHQFCYTNDLYYLFSKRRSKRAINKHLSKLESLNLIERHGNKRCPYQSYSISQFNKQQVFELIKAIEPYFIPVSRNGLKYVSLQILLDQVPTRLNPSSTVADSNITLKYKNTRYLLRPAKIYNDPSRPFNCSIPHKNKGQNNQSHLLNFAFKVLSQSTLRDFKKYPNKTFDFFNKAKNAKEKVLNAKNTSPKVLSDFIKKYFKQSKILDFRDS